jgi:hypothetical protein
MVNSNNVFLAPGNYFEEAQEDYDCATRDLLHRLAVDELQVLRVLISRTEATDGKDWIYGLVLHAVDGLAYERIGSFECVANKSGLPWKGFKL